MGEPSARDDRTVVTARPATSVVVPLDGPENADPWQLLATGRGMLVDWADGAVPIGRPWGAPLRATSALARGLHDVARLAGGSGRTGERLFRVELPGGFGAGDLVPAVGGGLRAAVRAPGSSQIAAQVKLFPVAPRGLLRGLSPALGVMALTIVAEMVAGDVQGEQLAAIRDGVERIDARLGMETEARLSTAEQTIRQAHAALLDGATIPESVGLGTAMGHLQVVRNMSTTLLAGWERVAEALPEGPTDGAELRSALGAVGSLGWPGFAAAVRTAHVAVTLDARRTMLSAAEAQLRHPDLPLGAFRRSVQADLAARSDELTRLRTLLSRLSTAPLTVSSWGLPHLVAEAAAENARAQALFATLGAAMTDAQRQGSLAVADGRVAVAARVLHGGDVQLHRAEPVGP